MAPGQAKTKSCQISPRNAKRAGTQAAGRVRVVSAGAKTNLRIAGNAELGSLAGLEGLTEVTGNFDLVDNDALLDLTAPEFPMTIGGYVQICENGSLVALPDTMMVAATGTQVSVIRNQSLANADALSFVTALGHPDARVAGNGNVGDFPLDPCPWIGDGVCDEAERWEGCLGAICDPQTGEGCCNIQGPTGLCALESDGEDCPAEVGGTAGLKAHRSCARDPTGFTGRWPASRTRPSVRRCTARSPRRPPSWPPRRRRPRGCCLAARTSSWPASARPPCRRCSTW